MVDVRLTQVEADALIAMEKHQVNMERHGFPFGGEKLVVPLQSPDKREQFLLDIRRSRIDLLKGTYQNRTRHVVVLIRLDFGGAPHRNPDDAEIPSPHLHIYREDYADKWAIPAPVDRFGNTSDLWQTLEDFMRFCNITRPPHFQRGLF